MKTLPRGDEEMGGYEGAAGAGFAGPFMVFPFLFWLIFMGFVIFGVTRILSGRRRCATAPAAEDSAEGILRERFARGDISPEEYERSVRALRGEESQGRYEDYVREAEEHLKSEREKES